MQGGADSVNLAIRGLYAAPATGDTCGREIYVCHSRSVSTLSLTQIARSRLTVPPMGV